MPVEKKSKTVTRRKAWIVSSALHSDFEDELVTMLGKAVRVDGAIRVFKPKKEMITEKTPSPALFAGTKGSFLKFKSEFPGIWFVEVLPRPRMVTVSREGIEFLLRRTMSNQRVALVSGASDHYRSVLLEIWRKMANPDEEEALRSSIREHFGDCLMADPEAGDDAKMDVYKRSLAEELALSWSEASSEEAKKRLSYFLLLVGAQPLEEQGSLVTFTGIKHKSKSALFKGDAARVLNPGWVWQGPDDTPQYLVKAEVTAAE